MDNNYVIIHGSFGSPCGNWFPWLQNELANSNKNVIVPQLPVGVGYQNYDNWKLLIDYYNELGYLNQTTTVIAHSIGPIFIIKYLLERNLKVKKLVLVCGFNNYLIGNKDYDTVNASMYCNNLSKIKKLCSDIICFYSDNDPYVNYMAEKEFADSISTKQILIKDGGHLNTESGYKEFKDLMEEI